MHDIRIENLTVRTQGGTVLVDDVSLAFGPNRPVCLIGETGSGKSLIMHAVMGSLPDSLVCEGKILFDGVDLLTQTADARRALWGRKIALLPQEPWLALDPTMRVQGQVAEVYTALHGVPAREAGQKADGELSAVGLAHAGNAYPFELSGGMAQRVSIAMAHAGGSPVMLADEPTKGLDRALCKVVGELLCFEVALGRAMMVITHDLELAEQVGGTVGVMRRGRLLEAGAAADILSAPSDPYTRHLVASLPRNWPVRDHPHPRNDATSSGDKVVVTGRGIGKSFPSLQGHLKIIAIELHRLPTLDGGRLECFAVHADLNKGHGREGTRPGLPSGCSEIIERHAAPSFRHERRCTMSMVAVRLAPRLQKNTNPTGSVVGVSLLEFSCLWTACPPKTRVVFNIEPGVLRLRNQHPHWILAIVVERFDRVRLKLWALGRRVDSVHGLARIRAAGIFRGSLSTPDKDRYGCCWNQLKFHWTPLLRWNGRLLMSTHRYCNPIAIRILGSAFVGCLLRT